MLLAPKQTITTGSPPRVTLATKDDSLVYLIPEGCDWCVVQLDYGPTGVWTSTAVITNEASLNGVNFYPYTAGAVTYTGVGLKAATVVTGIRSIRLRVSTAAAGTDVIVPTVNAGKNN